MDKVDNEFQFVEAFKVSQFWWITGAHQRIETGLNQRCDSTTKHRLLAEKVRFSFVAKSCLDYSSPCATNCFRPGERRLLGVTAWVLMDRHERWHATASDEFPAHHRAEPFRCNHHNIDIFRGNNRPVINGKAVSK